MCKQRCFVFISSQAHDPAYVERFCSGALDDAAVKRIGFGAVTRSPVLVERTLAEIAGVQQLSSFLGSW